MKAVIDYSNDKPITVAEDGGFKTYDVLNIADKLGNTVAQLTVENGRVVVTADNAYPALAVGRDIRQSYGEARRAIRARKPCGCLEQS